MKNKILIIGLSGAAKSGKDTAANAIVRHLGSIGVTSTVLSFADPIRKIGELFYFSKNVLTRQELKETWVHPVFNITPRKFMQKVGTEMFRDLLDKDVWVKLLEMKINQYRQQYADDDSEIARHVIIIPDVRFPNEAEMIKRNGGYIVKIERHSIDTSGDGWRGHESEKYTNSLPSDVVWKNDEKDEQLWRVAASALFEELRRANEIYIKDVGGLARKWVTTIKVDKQGHVE